MKRIKDIGDFQESRIYTGIINDHGSRAIGLFKVVSLAPVKVIICDLEGTAIYQYMTHTINQKKINQGFKPFTSRGQDYCILHKHPPGVQIKFKLGKYTKPLLKLKGWY